MFLRRYERRSGGRKRTYWALVESLRTGRGSRQRVVAYLGELARSEQSGWAQLGRNLSGKQRPSPSLFDPPHYDDPSDEEPVLVNLRGDRLEAALKKMQASVDATVGPGRCAADGAGGVGQNQERRCAAAHRHQRGAL